MLEQKLLKRKSKAQAEGNNKLLASACIDLAELYSSKGRYEDVIEEYRLVSAVYRDERRILDYGRAHRMIGEAYLHLREFDKALEHQRIHLDVAREQGDMLEEQRALATLGHTYLTRYLDVADNPDRSLLQLALTYFRKSLDVCESLTGMSRREHTDMKARLLANIGIVEECQGNFAGGIDLVRKSINICKANDIYEQLERGYNQLGSLYARQKEYGDAIQQYNLAIEVAGRLPDKASLICSSLVSKAELLIKLPDLHRAKSALRKAYKMKTPNVLERENIEHMLRIVCAMCRAEDALLYTSTTDYKTRKRLYEKLGDGASALKNYGAAVDYYGQMLDCAVGSGDSGRALSSCYVSLAQTYADDGNHDAAVEYFRKDADVQCGNLRESVTSLYSLADAVERSGRPQDDVEAVYREARQECQKSGDRRLEAKTLLKHVEYLRQRNRPTDVLQCELDALGGYETDSDSDEAESESVGDDVDLNKLTDESDDDVDEDKVDRPRRRQKGFVIKKNKLGETQLHRACIAGNVVLARKLLDQGHIVNVRDNCGWLPIHEACNHGHLEIVKMLVEKGAAINDRGGSECHGMTPLHDAVSNGHLPVIEYLLDKGASAVAKTDSGETPLYILKKWRGMNVPSDDALYELLVARMSGDLEKVGLKKDDVAPPADNKALVADDEPSTPKISDDIITRNSKRKYQIGGLRRQVDVDDDENRFVDAAADEYRCVMDNLKGRPGSKFGKRKSAEVKRPALLEQNEVGDDWLEDDLKAKKRKVDDVLLQSRIDEEIARALEKEVEPSKVKRRTQSTLIGSGFSRRRTSSGSMTTASETSATNKSKTQRKLTTYSQKVAEADSTTDVPAPKTPAVIVGKLLSIDVRIEGKLFRIPVPVSEIDSLTIKWLADEATKRFYKKEAMLPTLELETKNGAILSEEDFVMVLFPAGGQRSEEVHAKVVKWNVPPIAERYREACSVLNLEPKETIVEILETSTTVLSLSKENLRKDLAPFCRALNRHTNLRALDLSGNSMRGRCTELLLESLQSLDNLYSLNLSNVHLNCVALSQLSAVVDRKSALANLARLNLSYNPLKNDSLRHLAAITRRLRLRSLELRSVNIGGGVFDRYNENAALNLEEVEHFDVSGNGLSRDELEKFVGWTTAGKLRTLRVGDNAVEEPGLGARLARHFGDAGGCPNLSRLGLSRCRIDDDEALQLLGLTSNEMEEVDLSCNNITGRTLHEIFERTSAAEVNVCCCNLTRGFVPDAWRPGGCRRLYTTLDFVVDHQECDVLTTAWRREYGAKACVHGLDDGMLRLSVLD